MHDGKTFYYSMPTNYVFGEGALEKLGDLLAGCRKVLFMHGPHAVKRLGIDVRVTSLFRERGIAWKEIDFCTDNPDDSLIDKICLAVRDFDPDFILAAGGGSTIDAAKAVSLLCSARKMGGSQLSFRELYSKLGELDSALPIGVILTLPASGSECNNSFVIRDFQSGAKKASASALVSPRFALCDPSVMRTLSNDQLMCACSDIMAHLLEQLFCSQGHIDFTDHLIYGAISSLIESREMLNDEATLRRAYEGIMTTGSMSLSYLFSVGRKCDWVAHEIDHRIGSHLGVAHGHALSAIMPAWIRAMKDNEYYALRLEGFEKYCSYSMANSLSGLDTVSMFYQGLGLPTSEISATIHKRIDEFTDAILSTGELGRCQKLTPELCRKVLLDI